MAGRQTDTILRHEPKQLRGQRKVEQILVSAEIVFAEIGFDRATTNAIAAQAHVPIGSLYQFFDGKEAILEALANRYLSQSRAVITTILEDSQGQDLDTLMTIMLKELVALQEKRPYFLQCLSVSRPWCALTETVIRFQEGVVDEVASVLARKGISGPMSCIRLKARICVDTISALLPIVVYAQGRDRAKVTAEVKKLLVGYLKTSQGQDN